jgi:hypothetical protein
MKRGACGEKVGRLVNNDLDAGSQSCHRIGAAEPVPHRKPAGLNQPTRPFPRRVDDPRRTGNAAALATALATGHLSPQSASSGFVRIGRCYGCAVTWRSEKKAAGAEDDRSAHYRPPSFQRMD